MAGTINITGTGGIIEGNLGVANVNVNLDGSLYFDGNANDDRVVASDDNTAATGDFGTGTYSVSFWAYIPETGFNNADTWGSILGKGYTTSAPSGGWGFVRNSTNNNISFQQSADAGAAWSITLSLTAGLDAYLGSWVHIGVTRNGTALQLYFNGEPNASGTASETSNLTNSGDFKIGTNDSHSQSANITVADVKLFDDVVTATEMKYLASKIQADPDKGGLDNCESWWKINEGTGTNVVNHKKGSANGTITGAEWQYDKFSVNVQDNSTTTDGTFTVTQGKVEGLSLTSHDFDGSADYISLGTGLTTFDGATEGTISAWVKRDGTGSEDSIISHYDSTDSSRQFNFLVNSSNQAELNVQNDKSSYNSSHVVAGTTSLASGTWYHILGTFSTTNGQKIYVNGVHENTAATTIEDALDAVTSSANIGVLEQGGSNTAYAGAQIRDVRLYTHELSADQVSSLYSGSYNITPTNWWKIDEDTGATGTIEDYGTGTDVDGTGVSLGAYVNGTLDLDGTLTIAANGTLSAPRGTLQVADSPQNNGGTYTHNNGTFEFNSGAGSQDWNAGGSGTAFTFHNVTIANAAVNQYRSDTIEGTLTINSSKKLQVRGTNTAVLTMGTSSAAGTIANSGTMTFTDNTSNNAEVSGASNLFPFSCTGTDWDWDNGGSGSKVKISNINYDPDITTGGGGVTITLTGDCEFDAVTVSGGDTLDLNAQRMECSGNFTASSGTCNVDFGAGMLIAPRINIDSGTYTGEAGASFIVTGSSGGENMTFNDSTFTGDSTTNILINNGTTSCDWNNSGAYAGNLIVGSGTYRSINGTNNKCGNLTVATGGTLDGSDDTLTVAGDFTTSGGLIGKSALDFDGSNDYVTCGSHSSIDDIFDSGGTIEAWIKPDSDGENDRGMFAAKIYWIAGLSGESGSKTKLTLTKHFDGDDGKWTTTNTCVDIGKWNHVAITYNASAVGNDPIMYVNGKQVAITEDTTPTGTRDSDAASDFYIGNYSDSASSTFDGHIAMIRAFSDIRTEAEIRADMFNAYANMANTGNLVGMWQFDEGTGTTVDNVANSGVAAGSMVNSPAWAGAGTFDGSDASCLLKMTGSNKNINYTGDEAIGHLHIDAGQTTLNEITGSETDTFTIKSLLIDSGSTLTSTPGTLLVTHEGTASINSNGVNLSNSGTFTHNKGTVKVTCATQTSLTGFSGTSGFYNYTYAGTGSGEDQVLGANTDFFGHVIIDSANSEIQSQGHTFNYYSGITIKQGGWDIGSSDTSGTVNVYGPIRNVGGTVVAS